MRLKPASSRTAKAIQRNPVYKQTNKQKRKKTQNNNNNKTKKKEEMSKCLHETHKMSVLVEVWMGGYNLNYPISLNIAWALLAFTRKL